MQIISGLARRCAHLSSLCAVICYPMEPCTVCDAHLDVVVRKMPHVLPVVEKSLLAPFIVAGIMPAHNLTRAIVKVANWPAKDRQ